MAQNETPEQAPGAETKPQQTGKDGRKSFPIWIGAVAIVLVLAVGGYLWLSQKQPPKPTGPLEKITIAEASQPIVGPVYIAFKKGYFENEGLDVTLQTHTSGKASLNSVLAGKADLATVAPTPIMNAAMRGDKIYVFATIYRSEKTTGTLARRGKGISTPRDLKGKKIGVTIGTGGEFFLDVLLSVNRILRKDITAVNLRPEQMFDAFMKGEIDAVTTWPPHLPRLQKELGEKAITFYGEGIFTTTFNLVAMQDFVRKNPEAIRKVLRALIKAEELIKANPEESRTIIADYIQMDRAAIAEQWPAYDFEVKLAQSLISMLEGQARWSIERKLTRETEVPNFLNFIYLDGLNQVKPEGVSIIH